MFFADPSSKDKTLNENYFQCRAIRAALQDKENCSSSPIRQMKISSTQTI